MTAAPVPQSLDDRIKKAVAGSAATARATFQTSVDPATGQPLCIKYVASRYARPYLRNIGTKLRISDSAGFTWGNGVYATPLGEGVSSAIFGRVGVVGRFDPSPWSIFDARSVANEDLYLEWLSYQPMFRKLALTMHANLANQFLRNAFRTRYRIHAVLFHPDQSHFAYTNANDCWMVISNWSATGLVRRGLSDKIVDTWASVIIEDEFEDAFGGIGRRRMLGPLVPPQPPAVLAPVIAAAWIGRPNAPQVRVGA